MSVENYRKQKRMEYAAARIPELADVAAAAFVPLCESEVIPQAKAAEHPALFDVWEPNKDYAVKKIVSDPQYEDGTYLFKCRQAHTSQAIYPPHLIPALWARIPKPGEGTHDNPIPYDASVGMELKNGLFYKEDGVLYECFRDTGIPVYNRLADLINLYVRVSN